MFIKLSIAGGIIIVLGMTALAFGGALPFSRTLFLEEQKEARSIQDIANRALVVQREELSIEESSKNTTAKIQSDVSLKNKKEICTGADLQNFDCYEAYYKNLVQKNGVKEAFVDLRSRYGESAYVKSQCHPITHVIGRVAAEESPDVASAYAKGDSFCWSGYYHGVMEGIIGKIGRETLTAQMNGICKVLRDKEPYIFDHYNCVHGLGHGVMAITNDELFDSLKYCENLTDSWERSSCAGGVFMENIIIDGKNHTTKYLKLSEPLYPCTAVSEEHKTSCYLMQTSYILKAVGYNFGKVFEWCGKADSNYIDICYQSLGRDASGQSISNVEKTKTTCMLGKDERQQSNCVIGAVKDFVSYFHSDKQARELCAALPENLEPVCISTTVSYYEIF
ncbi:MAG: hypothetical protein AAB652_01485 [Patescibacteria group bacterium]